MIDAEEIEARDEIEVIDEPVAQINNAHGAQQPDTEGEEDPAETLERLIEDPEEVPEILKQDVAALSRPRSSMRSVRIFLILVLFLGLLVQALWLFRIQIVSAAPGLQPLL